MSHETSVSIQESIRILLMEDNKWMRESIINGLQGINPNLHFVKVTGNSKSALEFLQGNTIDLVIMDNQLEEQSLWGAELTKKILRNFPDLKIIFWSANTNPVDIKKAKEARAHGYISKESTNDMIANVIARVMGGEEVWHDASAKLELTEMEIKVMEQLAKGKSGKQIAASLLREEFLNKIKDEAGSADQCKTIDEYMDEVPERNRHPRLQSRVVTVQAHLVNITNKYKAQKYKAKIIKIAIEEYGEVVNKRSISPIEIEVLELRHSGLEIGIIARTLALSEHEVKRIIIDHNSDYEEYFI